MFVGVDGVLRGNFHEFVVPIGRDYNRAIIFARKFPAINRFTCHGLLLYSCGVLRTPLGATLRLRYYALRLRCAPPRQLSPWDPIENCYVPIWGNIGF